MDPGGRHRILAIEDDEVVARAWRRVFEGRGWVFAHATSVAEARGRMARWGDQSFDVTLLDLGLPDGWGEDLLQEFGQLRPNPMLVVVSGLLDARLEVELQKLSVGFCRKPVDIGNLMELIDFLSARVRPTPRGDPVSDYCRFNRLSARETQVVRLLLDGRSRATCADRLGCSPNTIDAHVRRVLRKTGRDRFDEVIVDVICRLRIERS